MNVTTQMSRLVVMMALAAAVGCSDRDAASTAPGSARPSAETATPGNPTGGLGDAVANGGRAADAAVETLDVKMALVADERLDTDDVNVDTDHTTKTVHLRGSVPSETQKTIAQQIAEQKAVGYRVSNELVVGSGPR